MESLVKAVTTEILEQHEAAVHSLWKAGSHDNMQSVVNNILNQSYVRWLYHIKNSFKQLKRIVFCCNYIYSIQIFYVLL